MRLQLGLLRIASLLTPAAKRADWFAEWSAELQFVHEHRREVSTRFCFGAFRDALWLRRNQPERHPRGLFHLDSPVRCLAFLSVCAAATVLLYFGLAPSAPSAAAPADTSMAAGRAESAKRVRPLPVPKIFGQPEFAILLVIAMSLLILPSVTTLSIGEYSGKFRARRWIFLAVKIALILPLVYFGSFDIGALVAPQMQSHGLIVGYVTGFRWALVDQRRRCPECLRRLACPTAIGCSSHLLLEWYGTELICTSGHGLMHVPEIPTSSYSVQRWVQLDPSWRGLFNVPT